MHLNTCHTKGGPKKLPTFLRTIPAAAISLALILTLSACAAQDSTGTGNGPAVSSGPTQTETTLDDGSLLEAVFSQSDPDYHGRITYYRDKVTDVLYIKAFCTSATGYAGAGGLSVMLDPDTGKPLTYTRYMEMYSTLNS